ncbi:DUF4340 domain-containing protein [Pokkaliibacter sp. CJK22405]|uniref:DUF4340 domain-containing protein n=1 Tax=Pokkaliibacter sp. CJK22405 TaxID=3384615 RepID=UPI003984A6DC
MKKPQSNTSMNMPSAGRKLRVNKLVPVLAVALLVQAGLVAAAYWPDNDSANQGPWLSFKPGKISEVVISDGKQSTHLIQKDKQWQVKELGMPANQQQLETMLNQLADEHPGWPSATSDEAKKRFKVAEKSFERKIELKNGDKDDAVVYLGTSPHYGHVYGRREGDKDVMNLSFNSYQAPADPHEWLDKKMLQVTAQPTMVTLPDLTLSYKKGQWQEEQHPDVALDKTKVDSLVNDLKELVIITLADDKQTARLNAESDGFSATMATQDKAYRYTIRSLDKDNWFIRREDQKSWFKFSSYIAKELQGMTLAKLEKDQPATANAAKGSDTGEADKGQPSPTAEPVAPPYSAPNISADSKKTDASSQHAATDSARPADAKHSSVAG